MKQSSTVSKYKKRSFVLLAMHSLRLPILSAFYSCLQEVELYNVVDLGHYHTLNKPNDHLASANALGTRLCNKKRSLGQGGIPFNVLKTFHLSFSTVITIA